MSTRQSFVQREYERFMREFYALPRNWISRECENAIAHPHDYWQG